MITHQSTYRTLGPAAQRWTRSTSAGRALGTSSSDPAHHILLTRAYSPRRGGHPAHHFQVMDISPPPESLGVHCLPPNTTNGDHIEIDGQSFIVEKTRVRWKLRAGRYVRDHQGLDVLGTSRYLSNMFLNGLLEKESGGERATDGDGDGDP